MVDSAAKLAGIRARFKGFFGHDCRVFRAPGRVNLIGEHTDYNQGFVMPAAIDFETAVAIAGRDDSLITVRSEAMQESVKVDLRSPLVRSGTWSDYVLGVVDQLQRSGAPLHGADLVIESTIPMGGGLSSSAAIEIATALAVADLNRLQFDLREIALLCQRAEVEFVGMRCGIMDQFICCHGRAQHALMLDCRSLDFQYLPLPTEAVLVIANTMVKHQLAAGEYNARRGDCEEGVAILAEREQGISSLRDISVEQLERHRDAMPDRIWRRCRHVVAENLRVEQAAEALKQNALPEFGRLMRESHRSLREDYEVSCRELDTMVELASSADGVYGARMTGGGFGGCTVNMVAAGQAESFAAWLRQAYREVTGLKSDIYICSAAEGAGLLSA